MIKLPQPWTRQPQIPVPLVPSVDGYPIIGALSPIGWDGINSRITLAGGISVAAASGAYAGAARAYVGDSTDNAAYATLQQPAVMGTNERFTFVCVYRSNAGANDSGTIAGLGASSGSSGNTLFRLVGGGTANSVALQTVSALGSTPYASGFADCGLGDQQLHTVVVAFDMNVDGTEELYVDGRYIGTQNSANGSPADATTFNFISTGSCIRGGAPIAPGNFSVALFVAIAGKISQSSALKLSQNPWQLYRPLPRKVFVGDVQVGLSYIGGGLDTLKALTESATGRAGSLGNATDTLKALTESATGRSGALGSSANTLKALTESGGGLTDVVREGYATDTLKALTETATGITGAVGSARDTLRAFNAAATGLAGAIGNARDTLKALLETGGGDVSSNIAEGGSTDTLKPLTAQATGLAGSVGNARDTFKALVEQAQGRTGMVGFSVDSLKALQAAAYAESGAQPIAPPASTGGAPVWWPRKAGGRPWWYRDLKDKSDELERMRQLRIEMGILPKAEAKRIAKVVREVEAFIEEIPNDETADDYIARADALTERINALVDKIEEDDDEQTIMEMSRFFFHHKTGASACRIH